MNNERDTQTHWLVQPRFVMIWLFIAALLPRLPGLSRFLTSDENTNIFFAGSDVIAAFLQGDLRGTYWHFYPGVTMSWLDAVGMVGQYGLARLTGQSVPAFSEYIYGDILSLVVANRLPYALLTAVAVPLIYLFIRKLTNETIAIFGALLLAFDPFYLAHSRVAHGDAPVAVFMSLSALAFYIFADDIRQQPSSGNHPFSSLRSRPTRYLAFSAVMGSLAALTKAPGQFMALFVIGMSILYAIFEARSISFSKSDLQPIFLRWTSVIAVWGFISLAVFILIWPSMWVDPIGTFRQMWDETFGKVNEGHLVFFQGQPTLDPGPWFYPYVIPFRLTPIVLIGSLLSLLYLIPTLRHRLAPPAHTRRIQFALFLLWLFTISLLLFGNLSPKKQDRYLLPLFPFLDLIAAIGWLGVLHFFGQYLQSRLSKHSQLTIRNSLFTIILLLQLLPIITYYPYYLTYFNPLMGGPARAAETTLVGWGEGMEQVAAYLNTKPNAENLYVASTPSQTLLPYFAGTGENFYTNDIAFRADYVVLYVAQMQRLAPSPEIVNYFKNIEPEHTITIHDIPYAKIYPGPKFILTDIPPEATPMNIGLVDKIRLAGYSLSLNKDAITLYWHTLAPLAANYTISVRAKAADGSQLSQIDSWPVSGLLPTSQWRQGDYVADTHALQLTDASQLDHIEVVVYELETGETLGPPLVLPVDE